MSVVLQNFKSAVQRNVLQVAELGVPYVLMHMRGDPSNMQSSVNTHYAAPVWQVVGGEMMRAIDKAVAAGIPAWNIITDPGE
jgi:2-amino-4-hydroxy-6-hydroxymethyldihydropteridine diphosphokinase/dihydropteroate synthase